MALLQGLNLGPLWRNFGQGPEGAAASRKVQASIITKSLVFAPRCSFFSLLFFVLPFGYVMQIFGLLRTLNAFSRLRESQPCVFVIICSICRVHNLHIYSAIQPIRTTFYKLKTTFYKRKTAFYKLKTTFYKSNYDFL